LAVRIIRKDDDPILKKISKKVETFNENLAVLIDDMKETMLEKNGIGIAAPQVGILKRVIVISLDEKFYELVNPEIIFSSGTQESVEGCLSSPGEFGIVKRPKKIKVLAKNKSGKEFSLYAKELLAVVLCHEIDHLNGILFKTKVIRMLDNNEKY
jgi:peptide deformylase